ncbi:hypothetical protein L6R52_42395, partial [Myxococcota bacterium]|nr:hypothetical protein [Myxococcota bacterium]
ALAPEPGQNARPSWRGRLPVPPVVAPVVAPVAAIAPPPSSPQETVAEPFEPTLTPREKGGLTIDPRTAQPGGTELLFSVPEPQKLLAESSSDDHTPIHAAALRFSSGVELPPETERDLPTPPPALSFETKSLRGDIELVSARGPTRPGFADVPPEGPPSSTQSVIEAAGVGTTLGTTLRALKGHRLFVVGVVGMVLAFAVGVMLARWAAEELRRGAAVEVPIEPRGDTPPPR